MNLVEMSELLGIRFTGENQLISNLAYDSRDVKEAFSLLFEDKIRMVTIILKRR